MGIARLVMGIARLVMGIAYAPKIYKEPMSEVKHASLESSSVHSREVMDFLSARNNGDQ